MHACTLLNAANAVISPCGVLCQWLQQRLCAEKFAQFHLEKVALYVLDNMPQVASHG